MEAVSSVRAPVVFLLFLGLIVLILQRPYSESQSSSARIQGHSSAVNSAAAAAAAAVSAHPAAAHPAAAHPAATAASAAALPSPPSCPLLDPPSVLPPLPLRSTAPVDGHWRLGGDALASNLTTPSGGGSPVCSEYGYHKDCCVNEQNCLSFEGAYVLNDGSQLWGAEDLPALLPSGARLLVMGDSLSYYLGMSLHCLLTPAPAPRGAGGRQLNAEYALPWGATFSALGASTCEQAEAQFGGLEAFLGGFDLVVLNYAAWYHEEAPMAACLRRVLPLLAAINAQPGKAAVFTDGWPSHFPTLDGYWSAEWAAGTTHSCATASTPSAGCLSGGSTVAALAASGFAGSARPRGPSGFLGACVPTPPGVLAHWDALIATSAAAAGVPVVQVSRVMRAMYTQHLRKYEVLDCSHLCFARDLFAPVWDAILRGLATAAAASTGGSNSSSSTAAAGAPAATAAAAAAGAAAAEGSAASLQPVQPLHLHFDSLCPSRYPLYAMHGSAVQPPHPLARLQPGIANSSLAALASALACRTPPAAPLTLTLTVSPCPSLTAALTLLVFVEVYYADLARAVPPGGSQRRGSETVFLGQAAVGEGQCCGGAGGGAGGSALWDFPWQRHGAWLADGLALGDELALRVVACESGGRTGRDGGGALCAVGGALGCAVTDIPAASSGGEGGGAAARCGG